MDWRLKSSFLEVLQLVVRCEEEDEDELESWGKKAGDGRRLIKEIEEWVLQQS